MRINESKLTPNNWDQFQELTIPESELPIKELRAVCNKIMRMLRSLGGFWDYHKASVLDRKLTLLFWRYYDGFRVSEEFEEWYISKATDSSLITRAKRWLVKNEYLIIRPEVLREAKEAERRWQGLLGGGD